MHGAMGMSAHVNLLDGCDAVHVRRMDVKKLRTRIEVIGLAEHVATQQLSFPAVVVTKPSHRDEPFIPLDELAAEVGDHADVYFIEDGAMMRDALRELGKHPGVSPSQLDVYGGAARVFPAGTWKDARLFLARDEEEGRLRVRHIKAHIRELRDRRGSLSYSTSTRAHDDVHKRSAALRAADLSSEVERLRHDLDKANAELSRVRAESARAPRRSAPAPLPGPAARSTHRRMFEDACDEIRHRMMVAWAEQTTPAEKRESPLTEFTFAPHFADSVDAITRNDLGLLDKIARCALKVLLGQERDAHKLEKNGATRPGDGAVAWRAYVEQASPSARRLHYWQVPGGLIEFSRVVLHDDYRP